MPRPNVVTACEIGLRVGGRFNTTFDVDGIIVQNKGVYLEIVDGERLVFTDTYTEGWKPAADPFMTAVLTFADDAAGGTVYAATVRHRSAETRKSQEEMGFFEEWGTATSQLEAYSMTPGKK